MPSTSSIKLTVSGASARLMDREYPFLEEMILYRVNFAIGRLLDRSRKQIESGDVTVKQALSGGGELSSSRFGDIFTPGEVSALSDLLSPGYHPAKTDASVVLQAINKIVPDRSDLRQELTALGLDFVSYQKSRYTPDNERFIGIGRVQ